MTSTILTEIKKAREWVAYYLQWRNEPSCQKKLRAWRRRLKQALASAAEQGLDIPPDPFAPLPPPPPLPPKPTDEDARAAAIQEAQDRVAFEWRIYEGQHYWAPWGESGWSAVVITRLKRTWCRVSRVNPRTGALTTNKGRVRRDLLVKRDPALQGKDRPMVVPTEIQPLMTPAEPATLTEPEPEPEPISAAVPKPGVERTPSEDAVYQERIAELLGGGLESDDW